MAHVPLRHLSSKAKRSAAPLKGGATTANRNAKRDSSTTQRPLPWRKPLRSEWRRKPNKPRPDESEGNARRVKRQATLAPEDCAIFEQLSEERGRNCIMQTRVRPLASLCATLVTW